MKKSIAAALVLTVLGAALSALAVQPGKTIEFKQSPMGVVVFDGTVHAKAVKSCRDCHKAGLFPEMKVGTVHITMEDINSGKLCGECHNGKVTFNTTDNCARCHRK